MNRKKNKKKGGVMNMQNENLSELKFLKDEMFFNMDCSYEGSTDPACDCDGVDGATA